MKVGKPKSKRVSVRLRHKIEKASSSKQRKARKEAKKNPQWRSRLKKDPGIPNLYPFKDKVLAEIEEGRRRKEEEAQKRRETARAQRLGTSVAATDKIAVVEDEDEDEDIVDADEDEEDVMDVEDDEEDGDNSNPMAALLASAQARAQSYTRPDNKPSRKVAAAAADDDEDSDSADAADETEWTGLDSTTAPAAPAQGPRQTQPAHRPLPKRALADPIKTVSALLTRLAATDDGVSQIMTHYQLPPLVLDAKSEAANTRFLVEVARKRGRLGRGGVPNLHAAALTVLGDLNDERLKLPALATGSQTTTMTATTVKPMAAGQSSGEIKIVQTLAEPFRIEGLFGDD